MGSIKDLKQRIVPISTFLERTVCPRYGADLIETKPGFYNDNQTYVSVRDGEISIRSSQGTSGNVVRLDDYLDAHQEVIENPEKIRKYLAMLNPFNPLVTLGIPRKEFKNENEAREFQEEQIRKASNNKLVQAIFGFGGNHDASILYEFEGGQDEMSKYIQEVVLKDYTIENNEVEGYPVLENETDDISLFNSRGKVFDGRGKIVITNSPETVFPKGDGRDIQRHARIRQLTTALRECPKVNGVYLTPLAYSPMISVWDRDI